MTITTIDAAHQAVIDWCAAHGRTAAGPRWEVYGDWREDPAEFETVVYWLLRAPGLAEEPWR